MARAADVDNFDDFDDEVSDDGVGDDEALSWAGDEEQGRAAPRLRDLDAAAEASAPDLADPEEAPGSGARRVATVAFAVPYLVITVGWIFAVQQLSSGSQSLFTEVLWQFGEFLAMLAGPLWFGAVLTLTRNHRPLVRVGWLALGLGVLLPWPIILQFLTALQFVGSLT